MKFFIAKYAVAYSALLLICSISLSAQNITDEQVEDGAVILSRSNNRIRLSFSATNLKYEKKTVNNQEFFTVDIAGFQYLQEPGRPKLPVYTSLIDLTGEEVVSIRITKTKTRRVLPAEKGITGLFYPSQPSATKNQNPQDLPFIIDKEFYSNNLPSATDTVALDYLGTIRGKELAQLIISPLIYYPADNYFNLITSLEVVIETSTKGSSDFKVSNTVFSPKGISSKGIGDYNEDDITPAFTLSPSGLILVSDTTMKPHLKPLIDWKTRKGFRVTELYIGENGLERNFASIKDTLNKIWAMADEDHPHPDFLLIGGDLSIVPKSEGATNLSDIYYSEFDGGGDFLPDMYTGRLPASDTSEMKAIVEKILEYELFQYADTINHFEKTMLIAGYDPESVDYMDGQLNYASNNYLNSSNNITNYLFSHQNDAELRAERYDSARAMFNEGIGFVNYTGHGSPSEWLSTGINYNFPKGLSNNKLYPVIISNACQTAQFSSSTNIATEFVKAKGKGALAFIGCTVNTYWNEDYWWSVGLSSISSDPGYASSELGFYDRLFHKNNEQPSDWFTSLGQIIHAGNMAVLASTSPYKKIYWEYYHLLGDPSIIPMLGTPTEFNIEIPDSIPIALKGLNISSDPFSYAAISHFDTLWDASTVDPSGNVFLQIPDIAEKDSCLIVVTGQNKKPFLKTLYFFEPDTAWLDIIDITPTDKNGNANDAADYGEILQLDLSIQNAGQQAASDVYIKLTSANEYLNINQPDSFIIGEIPLLSEISLLDKFNIEIYDSIPDNTLAQLMLDLYYGQNVVRKTFEINLHAPELSIVSFFLDDHLAGNGNMRPEPGEDIEIILNIANTGSSSTSGNMELSNLSPYLTIGDLNNNTGIILPGDTISISFSGSLDPDTPDGEYITFSSYLDCDPYSAEGYHGFISGGSIEDFESLNFSTFPWDNSGSFPWIITSSDSYNNIYSAMSGLNNADDNKISRLKLMLNIPKEGTLSFWYRVSSELYETDSINFGDKFRFLINDSEMISRSGEVSWTKAEFVLDAGVYNLEWNYSKDPNAYEGYDRVWLDMIEFPSVSFIQSDILIDSIVSPSEPTKDYEIEQVICKVINVGRDTIYSIPLTYVINNSFPVNELFLAEIYPGKSAELVFTETADLSNDGKYIINIYRSTPDDYALNDSIYISVLSTDIYDIYTNSDDFTIGPNPFNSYSIINSNTDLQETRFSLINNIGLKVWEYEKPYISRGDKVTISGEGLAVGLYILKIDALSGSYLYKLIKN